MITNILLIAILLLLLSFAIGFIVVLFYFRTVFYSFITPDGDDDLTPLSRVLDSISQVFARSIVAQAKTTFMGLNSAAVRGEQAVMGDIIQDTASQTPLGSLLMSMPTLRKSLRRNPQLMNVLSDVLSRMAGNHGISDRGEGTPSFKL